MDTDNNQAQPNTIEGNAEQAKDVSTNPALGIKKIRTFAEDLAEAKAKAGVKDTTHKEEPKPKQEEKKEEKPKEDSEALKEARKEFEAQVQAPERPKEEPKEELKKEPVPTPPPVSPPPKAAAYSAAQQPSREFIEEQLAKSGIVTTHKIEEDTKKKTSTPAIQTYKNDVADTIAEKNISAIDIVAAEQDKKKVRQAKVRRGPSGFGTIIRNIGITLFSIGLIGSGAWVIAHFYDRAQVAEVAKPAPEPNEREVIATNSKDTITVGEETGSAFTSLLLQKQNQAPALATDIVEIDVKEVGIFGERTIEAETVLSKLGAPENLVRSVREEFLFGYHGGEDKAPFFIFATDDFDTTFRGMLDWENTISNDLFPLFGDAVSGLPFRDIFVRNKDTRSLIDNSGETRVLYAFPNTQTLVITTNEDTFFEIFARMTASNRSSN